MVAVVVSDVEGLAIVWCCLFNVDAGSDPR